MVQKRLQCGYGLKGLLFIPKRQSCFDPENPSDLKTTEKSPEVPKKTWVDLSGLEEEKKELKNTTPEKKVSCAPDSDSKNASGIKEKIDSRTTYPIVEKK